jgi:hypothetical protein
LYKNPEVTKIVTFNSCEDKSDDLNSFRQKLLAVAGKTMGVKVHKVITMTPEAIAAFEAEKHEFIRANWTDEEYEFSFE